MNPSKTRSHQESGCGISSCKGASDPTGLVSSRLQMPKGLNRSSSVTLETEKSRTPAPETDVCQWTIGNQAFEPRTGSRGCAAHCKGRAALEPCCKPHCRVHHINRKTMGMSAGVQVPRNLLLCTPPELSLSLSFSQSDLDNRPETSGVPVRESFTLGVHSHTTTTFCPQKIAGSQEVNPAFHRAASHSTQTPNRWPLAIKVKAGATRERERESKALLLHPNKSVQRPQELETEMDEAKYTEKRQRALVRLWAEERVLSGRHLPH